MNHLTVTFITLNEEHDLPRALASLADLADEIVVVDAGSTDRTREIAAQNGARVFVRAWTDYSTQRNFAAAQATHEWILAIDADEELSPELQGSVRAWKNQTPAYAVYEFSRLANYLGKWIRHSGWHPDRQKRLYRRDRARFVGIVHESLQVSGQVGRLDGDLYHYTVRTLAEHVANVENYTTLAAQQMFASGGHGWRAAMLLASPWALIKSFILRCGFLDGAHGWLIARMAARSAFLKHRKLRALVRSDFQTKATKVHGGDADR